MAIKSIFAVIFLFGTLVFLQCDAQALVPTEGEEKICEEHKDNRILGVVKKDKSWSCSILCEYKDDDGDTVVEKYDSPNDQLCCIVNGALPNAVCKDGKCELPT